jgi:hypothetical protein
MLEVEAGYYLVNKQFHDLLRSTARANDEKSRANFFPSSTFYCSSLRGFLFSKLFVLAEHTIDKYPVSPNTTKSDLFFQTSLEGLATLKSAFLPPAERGAWFWEIFPLPCTYETAAASDQG